jgi:hypothetical protein
MYRSLCVNEDEGEGDSGRAAVFVRLGDDPQIVDRSRIESGIGIGSVSIIMDRSSYRSSTTIKMSSFFDVTSTIALLDTPESFTASRTKKKGKKSALV